MERSGLILVVEDEADIRNLLLARFEREGFRVLGLADGAEAIERAPALGPALVVLDLMLPGASGEAVCRALRAHPDTRNVPILMLTARGEESDRVAGFELGADDYVTKPFSVRELVVRVRALLRRAAVPGDAKGELHLGRLDLDFRQRRVWVENAEVHLSPNEFRLLAALARRGGEPLSARELARELGTATPAPGSEQVEGELTRIREKLGPLGGRVEAVPGRGYRLRPVG